MFDKPTISSYKNSHVQEREQAYERQEERLFPLFLEGAFRTIEERHGAEQLADLRDFRWLVYSICSCHALGCSSVT